MLGLSREYRRIENPPQRHDRHGPMCDARQGGPAPGDRRGGGPEGAVRPVRRRQPDAQELEPALQAQSGQDPAAGDVYELAEVVRNLAIRESEKGLSTGEKQMFTRAKKRIAASELMYALEMEEGEAEARIDQLIEDSEAGTRGRHDHPLAGQPAGRAGVTIVGIVPTTGGGERLGSIGPEGVRPLRRAPAGRVEPGRPPRGLRPRGRGGARRPRAAAGSRPGRL